MAHREKRIRRTPTVAQTQKSSGFRLPWGGWAIPRRLLPVLVVVAVLILTTSIVMAGVLVLHRTVNFNFTGASMTVTPEGAQSIVMGANETKNLPSPYTITNVSSVNYTVTAMVTGLPSDVTLSFSGDSVGVFSPAVGFTLMTGQDEVVTVTVTTGESPANGAIDIAFTNSLM